jgi:hypothetical protein
MWLPRGIREPLPFFPSSAPTSTLCRSIVIVDSQGRERISLGVGTGDGCAVIEVNDGIPNDDTPTSVSLTAERGSAEVYVSNGARAMRLDLDGLETKTFDDEGFPTTRR